MKQKGLQLSWDQEVISAFAGYTRLSLRIEYKDRNKKTAMDSMNASENHSSCQLIYPCLATHQSARHSHASQSLVCHFNTRWRQCQKFQLKFPFTMKLEQINIKNTNIGFSNKVEKIQQKLPTFCGQFYDFYLQKQISTKCVRVCFFMCVCMSLCV